MSTNREMTLPEILATLDGGGTIREMREALEEVVNDCLATGNAGSVTLKLDVKRTTAGQVMIHDSVKAALPKRKKDGNIFFRHPEGGLTRTNPEQFGLGLDSQNNQS